MLTGKLSQERKVAVTDQAASEAAVGPDTSWKGLYRARGIAAFLYLLFGLIVPTIMVDVAHYDFDLHGGAFLEFVGTNKVWFMALQTMVLGVGILAVVTFAALFVALKDVDKGYAALGALIAITMQILFVAYYPVVLGQAYLGELYLTAGPAQQAELTASVEVLVAQINQFNPLYEPAFAGGILILSLLMLKGVFHKAVAYLGIVTAVGAFVGAALWPVIGLNYFFWWLPFMFWYAAVGWKLYRLGSA
jgi:hypothetical protein